jgi:hypothetical protein
MEHPSNFTGCHDFPVGQDLDQSAEGFRRSFLFRDLHNSGKQIHDKGSSFVIIFSDRLPKQRFSTKGKFS